MGAAAYNRGARRESEVTELLRPLRTAYYKSVTRVAFEILDRAPWASDEERDEAIENAVCNTSWTSYPHSAAAVLLVSDNDDAAVDMLGEEGAHECGVEHSAALAMLKDVRSMLAVWKAHPELIPNAAAARPEGKEVRP